MRLVRRGGRCGSRLLLIEWPLKLKSQLAYLMAARGLSAAELARRADVPKQTISDWLSGIKPRNLSALKSVAICLGTSIDDLLFGAGNDLHAAIAQSSARNEAHNADPTSNGSDVVATLGSTRDLFAVTGFDGFFKLLSPPWEQLLGLELKQLYLRPVVELIHIDDVDRSRNELMRHIRTGSGASHHENRYLAVDGRIIPLEWSSISLKDDRLIVAAVRDMSEAISPYSDVLSGAYASHLFERICDVFGRSPVSVGFKCAIESVSDDLSFHHLKCTIARLTLMLVNEFPLAQRFDRVSKREARRIGISANRMKGQAEVLVQGETPATRSFDPDLRLHQVIAKLIGADLDFSHAQGNSSLRLLIPT